MYERGGEREWARTQRTKTTKTTKKNVRSCISCRRSCSRVGPRRDSNSVRRRPTPSRADSAWRRWRCDSQRASPLWPCRPPSRGVPSPRPEWSSGGAAAPRGPTEYRSEPHTRVARGVRVVLYRYARVRREGGERAAGTYVLALRESVL
jgi:hypothetical protein